MEAVYVALGACFGVAVLIIGLAIPLYQGKIKRNNWYGFRTSKTLSSDKVWYPVNRESAKYFMAAGVITLITVLILFLLRNNLSPEVIVIIMVVVNMTALIGAVIKSFMFLSKF